MLTDIISSANDCGWHFSVIPPLMTHSNALLIVICEQEGIEYIQVGYWPPSSPCKKSASQSEWWLLISSQQQIWYITPLTISPSSFTSKSTFFAVILYLHRLQIHCSRPLWSGPFQMKRCPFRLCNQNFTLKQSVVSIRDMSSQNVFQKISHI